MFNYCTILGATTVTIKILLIRAATGYQFQFLSTELIDHLKYTVPKFFRTVTVTFPLSAAHSLRQKGLSLFTTWSSNIRRIINPSMLSQDNKTILLYRSIIYPQWDSTKPQFEKQRVNYPYTQNTKLFSYFSRIIYSHAQNKNLILLKTPYNELMKSVQIPSQSSCTLKVINLSREKCFQGLYQCHKPFDFESCCKRFQKSRVDQ